MTVKKLSVLAFMLMISSFAIGQTDWGWDWKDSSKISVKSMPQHNEFLNNQFPYPAKPRNQWELGISAGAAMLFGDISPKVGFGGGLSLRKAIDHNWSLRASYTGLLTSGMDYRLRSAAGNPAFNRAPFTTTAGGYVANFKNKAHILGLDAIYSLNTASNYRGNPKWNWYLLAGYSLVASQSTTDVPTGAVNPYAGVNFGQKKSDIRDAVKALPSTTTLVRVSATARRAPINVTNSQWMSRHAINLGAGVAYKLSNKINVGLEQKFIAPGEDEIDGINAGRANDIYSFTSARVNINIGSTAKKVQPLWWINPNNFVYSELNNPKHMKLPKVTLADADNDGVTDQFDLEPNTPQGAPVDSHGRAKDTDGDGVLDYKDKEPLTPMSCFPVDANGVGKCPEPACCKEIKDMMANWKPAAAETAKPECNIGDLPSVSFKGNAKLSKDAQAALAAVAAKVNANPNCKVKVIGFGSASKAAQQQSWERVNAVIKYLVEKQGIAESRLIFTYGQDGDANTVDLQGTTEEGPNTVPAPHPNLRKG